MGPRLVQALQGEKLMISGRGKDVYIANPATQPLDILHRETLALRIMETRTRTCMVVRFLMAKKVATI